MMKNNSYQETIDFLFSQLPMYQRTGAAAYKANLNNTLNLCSLLGNPEADMPAVHVAGTNGKGSVSHMIASVLMEQGYKTGLYTSPHLLDFRERITVNGEKISEEGVINFVQQYQQDFIPIKPSFFELTFAMALYWFQLQKTDVVVFETGMGGRLDSTNVVKPIVSVITNIGHDHMQFLGDTLEKVAAEKAGIIKPGVPVVIGLKQPETTHVYLAAAEVNKAPILFSEEHILVTPNEKISYPENNHIAQRSYTIDSEELRLPEHISTPLIGLYQQHNIRTALAALSIINNTRFSISTSSIKEGINKVITNTGLRGRWETIQNQPLVVCDTGHNKEGLLEVRKMIDTMHYQNLHIVMGVVNDKDCTQILGSFPADASFYFCKANIPRGLDAEILRQTALALGIEGVAYNEGVGSAIKAALANAKPQDMVFIGGSTFIVADALQYFK